MYSNKLLDSFKCLGCRPHFICTVRWLGPLAMVTHVRDHLDNSLHVCPVSLATSLLHRNVSIPDADLARHPACLTNSTEKGHQGIVDYCSLWWRDRNNIKTGKASVSHGNVHSLWFLDYPILGNTQHFKNKSVSEVSNHQKKNKQKKNIHHAWDGRFCDTTQL